MARFIPTVDFTTKLGEGQVVRIAVKYDSDGCFEEGRVYAQSAVAEIDITKLIYGNPVWDEACDMADAARAAMPVSRRMMAA